MVQPLWKRLAFLKKFNLELPYEPAGSAPGYVHKRIESTIHSHTNVNVHNSQKVETTKCLSADKRENNIWCIYSTEYYSATKRNQVVIHHATWMSLVNVL